MPLEEKIDIVYLWVNGNDPVWRRKRQTSMSQLTTENHSSIAKYGNVEGRYRDNDELRYSLRALERYFPDCGHVYIVTDAQTPSWLHNSTINSTINSTFNSTNGSAQITIIDHADLIPPDKLPTFDSANIESYIHRIPNLSERYFYLNDDVFFGAPVDVASWFYDAGIYVGWSDDAPVLGEALQPDATALDNACRLSIQWLKQHGKTQDHISRTFAHSPRPMLKSMLVALETEAADLFEAVRSTTFRVWDKPTIVSDFVMRWALENGQATLRDYSHIYLSTGDIKTAAELQSFIATDGLLDFFCINDTTDNAHSLDPRLTAVQEALQMMFPNPSRYECPVKIDVAAPITSAYIASGNKPA